MKAFVVLVGSIVVLSILAVYFGGMYGVFMLAGAPIDPLLLIALGAWHALFGSCLTGMAKVLGDE